MPCHVPLSDGKRGKCGFWRHMTGCLFFDTPVSSTTFLNTVPRVQYPPKKVIMSEVLPFSHPVQREAGWLLFVLIMRP